MKRAVHQSAHVVAVGQGWRGRFLDRWSFEPERTSIVENGSEMVDRLATASLRTHQPFLPSNDPSNDPNRESNDQVNVVYVGGFEPWHGVTVLVEAFAKALPLLAVNHVTTHLYLIGDGRQRAEIDSLIEQYDLHSAITLTGFLPAHDMAPYLQNAEIGACPYCGRANFSGLKILDYKAAGLATIASGQDGEPAILEHGKSGWIVPPGDVEALAEAIVELSANAEMRRKMGQAARADAEKLHRWSHTATQLETIFSSLANDFNP